MTVLVLDFDGVLCDSLEECILVAHLTHARKAAAAFANPGLDGVPPEVAARFRGCRPFMTHLGHFLHGVAGGPPPRDHATFAAGYAALEPRAVERFTAEANALRAVIRRDYVEQWLERHSVDPRLAALVSGAYIATARDGESVRQILRSRGVQFADARIFHSLREKTQALESIASLESVPSSDVRLVDDSIQNCIAARDAGFEANWASWGYGAPGDEDIARSHGIRVLTVEELLAG